ncbi:uncharacterized protein LOC125645482 isoform X1 [Ostrea edulis]|uniref:uncharacterized protein LOC125645482 isoform X1 n=1 Tax=Ostrea edulis TaxID=37623 RepID=UPI0020954163|nr:uncharacterized protein LOC125645482 isoform X1 [Ostrea edulis]
MGSKEVLLATGVPDDFGKTLRNDNGLYKTTSYEPSNKNQPYKAKKCSTPKPYQGHTYKHTVNTNRQYREYEARTYDNVYVYSKIYHEKPKKEAPQRAESPPPQQKTETPPPPRQSSPPLPYSAVESIRRSFLLAEVRTASPEQSNSVFS